MKIADFIGAPGAWLAGTRRDGVVVSCRVRLARNVRGEVFPSWAKEEERVRLWSKLNPMLAQLSTLEEPIVFDMAEVDSIEKQILRERHLISVEHSKKGAGSGVVIRQDETVSIMVNEEDHMRIQAMSPGRDIESLWQKIDAVDSEIEGNVQYAFSHRLGYLTACPSNVGTGLRASFMLHLPGLSLMNEMEPTIKALTKIGLAVRGLLGEGTEASGNMFQISNQTTLGESERTIMGRMSRIVSDVAENEKNARLRLMEQREAHVRDYVGRAFGVLLSANLLSSKEMLDLLSGLWIGLDLGLAHNVSMARMRELMLLTQPGHMQRMMGRDLNAEERDHARAKIVREKLKRVTVGV